MVKEERSCPVFWETKMYKVPLCNGKILRKEPAFTSEGIVGPIYGQKMLGANDKVWKLYAVEEKVPYYIYECEHGHLLSRPVGWADVPIVPPGTIKSMHGGTNRQPKWYQELPEEEKEMAWKQTILVKQKH